MWLLNVETYELEHFIDASTPAYAILSHTWEKEEVSFQEMRDLENAKLKAGFWKIDQTCPEAKFRGLRYAWVDTCCIDKTSSSELQESINSMFGWYRAAEVCFAYLSDVEHAKLFPNNSFDS